MGDCFLTLSLSLSFVHCTFIKCFRAIQVHEEMGNHGLKPFSEQSSFQIEFIWIFGFHMRIKTEAVYYCTRGNNAQVADLTVYKDFKS